MKIVITISQLKRVLKTEDPKYPFIVKGENFNDDEFEEFFKLLQQN